MQGSPNREAAEATVAAMAGADPVVVGVARAGDVLPGMQRDVLLHAGPPLTDGELVGPMLGALTGALRYEGLAQSDEEARRLLDGGHVGLSPAHDHAAVGPMAGVVSWSMPVFVVRDAATGATAHVTINEGLGRTLRFGANGPDVLTRLRWLADVAAPALHAALELTGGISLRALTIEALTRGDECHNRNKAATAQLCRVMAPAIVRASQDAGTAADVLEFMAGNDHFFLNLSMAAGKTATMAAGHLAGSPVVTAMAGNGVDMGIRVAGTGDRWFTAPAPRALEGRWLDGRGAGDAAAVMGDSFVTEVNGLGAFALAAAPAISTYIGGTVDALVETAREMYAITVTEHPHYRVPYLGYRGTAFGIDVGKVAASGVAPVVNAGLASKEAGVGQVGASLVRLPLACFTQAAAALGT